MSKYRRPMRPSLRHGLPYGWWKSTDVWAAGLSLLMLAGMLALILAAWFLDWKPVW